MSHWAPLVAQGVKNPAHNVGDLGSIPGLERYKIKNSNQSQVGTATAAAKSLQSCPTLCDPIDGSPPGSAPLGFSRQEYWSGLPFPSPMHEREKWK